jgi:hypothetical protein
MEEGIGWIGLIFIVVLVVWGYNHYTAQKIEDDYGYRVETSQIMEEADCSTLEPENPYNEGSGHYAGFEWGMEGNECNGNSDSFIGGCEEYQNQENAHQYCLSRDN